MADAHDDAAANEGALDLDAPPTEDELREADALARALEGASTSDDATFLRAVRLAHAPEKYPLSDEENARIAARALGKAPSARSGRVIRVAFGAASFALAAAAAIVLVLGGDRGSPAPTRLAQSRSTQELFREPFAQGQASARIDRIALARSSDLRENRFARWGVR
ncbi:MAG: hypothetical protein JNM74_17125 [Myxococcales bacterium]|nr:hypothetical protein [Myxococcales bacterium]